MRDFSEVEKTLALSTEQRTSEQADVDAMAKAIK